MFMVNLMNMKEVPIEMEPKLNSEHCVNDEQSSIESVSPHMDHKWEQRIEDLTIGNGNSNAKESQFSSNISEYLFNRSIINVERTQIIHVDSPAKFYIKNRHLEINQMELNEYANIMTAASTVDMNTVYLVQKSNDLNWYRAKALTTIRNGNDFIMIFIDHGYKHVVNKSK